VRQFATARGNVRKAVGPKKNFFLGLKERTKPLQGECFLSFSKLVPLCEFCKNKLTEESQKKMIFLFIKFQIF
jgi:hypothetical protein